MPQPPRDQIPANGTHERAENDRGIDHICGHDSGANRLRDVEAEEQKRNEIKEGGPDHRILWAQHAGRDHGRDRIGGIMQAVQQVEDQRD
jgi:hypothetical protein